MFAKDRKGTLAKGKDHARIYFNSKTFPLSRFINISTLVIEHTPELSLLDFKISTHIMASL